MDMLQRLYDFTSHVGSLRRPVSLLGRLECLRINVLTPNQHLPSRPNIKLVDLALDSFAAAN
jgi:hypothetical protein